MSGSLLRKGIWPKLPLLLFLVAAVAGLALLGRGPEVARAQTTFNVNDTRDLRDINPGDGICDADLAPGVQCTLRAAIDEANGAPSGVDVVINLPAGTFAITITNLDDPVCAGGEDDNLCGDFDIGSSAASVTIQGAGVGATVIDGNGVDQVIDVFAGTVVIKGLTIRGGSIGSGSNEDAGCLENEDTLTLENVTISDCRNASDLGGGIDNEYQLTIKGTVRVLNSVALGSSGGGIYNDGGTITIDDGATLEVSGNRVEGNSLDGGGIYNDGTITLKGTATAPARLLVTNNRIVGDDGQGGGIYNDGTIEPSTGAISVIVVSGNDAGSSGSGGGVYNANTFGTSSEPLINVTVAGNRAGSGAGIYSGGGTVNLAAATIAGNEVTDEDGNGGGIGLGIVSTNLTLTNATISGNRAGSDDGQGGGIWAGDADTVTLTFVTIANNQAGSDDNNALGGGIYFGGTTGAKEVTAAILADNTAGAGGPDCWVAVDTVSLTYSVIKSAIDGSPDPNPGCNAGDGSADATDPLLRPLASNGGAVLTHAIPATSPAIDRVPEETAPCSGGSTLLDARGVARNPTAGTGDAIDGNLDGTRGCDAGAFESTPVDISVAKADAPDPAFSGGTLTYTLTVSVASLPGSNWATEVVVSDTLPAGTAFQSVSVSPAGAGSCVHSAGVVTCSIANIADGSSVTITIVVQVTASGGTLTNTATVAMNEADPGPGANSATATTAVAFSGAPGAPTMVAIWPGSSAQALITWQAPSGVVTFYRLQSSLNFDFTFGVTTTDIPVGSLPFPGNIIGVGLPTADGQTFYYRLAACNSLGCSTFAFAGALAARQFPAGTTEHWNFVMGAFEFAGTVFAWGQNQVSVAGKNSDFNFYDGVQGFGGVLKGSCAAVAPGSSCTQSWAAGSPFVSVSQAFPPFGEVGVAVRTH